MTDKTPASGHELPPLIVRGADGKRVDIAKVLAPLIEQIVKLGARVNALEQRKAMSWEGVWRRERTYFPGSVCTDRGSAWVAQIETRGVRPGEGNVFWKLIDKRNSK